MIGEESMPSAARKTDISMCPSDAHGNLCCSHSVQGPAITGSPNVIVVGQPQLRATGIDNGVHSSCCGPNTWVTVAGSQTVYVNDLPAVRRGDTTQHCGGAGSLITGADDVVIGG